MRKSMLGIILAAMCLLVCAGCESGQAASSQAGASVSDLPVPADASSASSSSAASQSTAKRASMSASDARGLLSETIDTDTYDITEGQANGEYYVFTVTNKADGAAVGQVAVNQYTGEKHTYQEDGTLGDYSGFALYDPAVDAVASWEGIFSDGTRTLELLPMDDRSFEYALDDLTGVARGTGNTATDEENGLVFTYEADGTITLSGAAEGVFSPAE